MNAMSAWSLFLFVSAIASIVGVFGIPLTILAWRRGQRRTALAFTVANAIPLARVRREQPAHGLTLFYERAGEAPRPVQGAYIKFVRVANVGSETIRREDLLTSDPLRIEVSNAAPLDVSIAGTARQVNNFTLGDLSENTPPAAVSVTFDFLDPGDGALIQVLTDSPRANIRLTGTVIGIPNGVEAQKEEEEGNVNGWGCLAIFIPWAGLMGIAYFIGRIVTHTDIDRGVVALLLFEVGAAILLFVVGLIGLLFVGDRIGKGRRWPDAMQIPPWFRSRHIDDSRLSWNVEFDDDSTEAKP
jgi:hypothetical protein